MKLKKTALILILLTTAFYTSIAHAQNTTIDSFNISKRLLEQKVFFDDRITLYCGATFDNKKNVNPPPGFTSDKYNKRSKKIEWEHVLPAENFGRAFSEWREGHTECVNSKGKAFKGRNCASKMNMEYRFMQADLYNLKPSIGSVNALRSNHEFTLLPNENADFGACQMKIENRKAEPPANARGVIARAYMYMDQTYKRYNMSRQTRQLMNAWHKQYPATQQECMRAKRIEDIQGNEHPIYAEVCQH